MNEIATVLDRAGILSPEQREHWKMAWLSTVDHKRIGILYMVTGLVFFVFGGIEALLIRLQLAVPNNTLLQPDTYNMVFTMHGTTMIFLVAMPVLFGLANYVVPLQIGARDMAFPRLNAYSFWLVPFGGILLHFSFLAGGAPAVGWFAYAPLSETAYSSQPGVDYWALSLLVLGIGSVGANINFIATVLCSRAPNMTLRRLPLFSWMIFVNAFLVILALPVLNAGLVMILIDRLLNTHFFLRARRLRHHVAAYFLGLWTSGGLHRGHPGFRHLIRDHSGLFAQADFWLRVCRRLDCRDRLPQPRGLGAPYVYDRPGSHDRPVLRRLQHADRDPNRSEGAELERDHDRRPSPFRYADALLRRGAGAIPGRRPNGCKSRFAPRSIGRPRTATISWHISTLFLSV